MSVVSRYLCGHVLIRLIGAWIIFVALALLFDLLDAGDDLLDDGVAGVRDLLVYIALRLPSLMAQMLPVAALAGSLLSVTVLLRHRELVVLWGFGQSPYTIMKQLMPLILLLAAMQFVLDDVLVPPTVKELRHWQVGAFKGNLTGMAGDHLWVRSNRDIARLSADLDDPNTLKDVTIFRRDEVGNLETRLSAQTAYKTSTGWRLTDVSRVPLGGVTEHLDEFSWDGEIDAQRLQEVSVPPRELQLITLISVIRADAYDLRPIQSYLVWANARLALLAVPGLLLVLPFALAREGPRQQPWLAIHIPAVAIGFCFIVLSGVVLALGETGLINPVLASWMPTIMMTALVVMLPAARLGARRERKSWTPSPTIS